MSDKTYTLTVPLYDYNNLLKDSETLKELKWLAKDIEIKTTPTFKPIFIEDYSPPKDYISDDSFETKNLLAKIVNMIRNR